MLRLTETESNNDLSLDMFMHSYGPGMTDKLLGNCTNCPEVNFSQMIEATIINGECGLKQHNMDYSSIFELQNKTTNSPLVLYCWSAIFTASCVSL